MSDAPTPASPDDWTPIAYEDEAPEPKPREVKPKPKDSDDATPTGGAMQMPLAMMLPQQVLDGVNRLVARLEKLADRLEAVATSVDEGMAVIADALDQIKPAKKEPADDA